MLSKKNVVLQEELCIKKQTANQKYVFSFADKQRRQKQAAALNTAIMMAVTASQAEYLNELRRCVERSAALFPERKFLRCLNSVDFEPKPVKSEKSLSTDIQQEENFTDEPLTVHRNNEHATRLDNSSSLPCQDIRFKNKSSSVKINRVIYTAQSTHAVLLASTNNVGISSKTLKNDESPKINKSLSSTGSSNNYKFQDIRCLDKSQNINRMVIKPEQSPPTKQIKPLVTKLIKKSLSPKENIIACRDVRLSDKNLKINRYVENAEVSEKPSTTSDNGIVSNIADKVSTTTTGETIKESTDDNIAPHYKPYTEDWSFCDEKVDYSLILEFPER